MPTLTPALFKYLDKCYRTARKQPSDPWTDGMYGPSGTTVMNKLCALGYIELRQEPYTQAKIQPKGGEAWKAHRRTMMPEGIEIVRGTEVYFAQKRIGWLHRTGAPRGMKPKWYAQTDSRFTSEHRDDRVEAVRDLMRHLGMPVPGEGEE